MIIAAILTAVSATAITTMCLRAANRPMTITSSLPVRHVSAGHSDPARRDYWKLAA